MDEKDTKYKLQQYSTLLRQQIHKVWSHFLLLNSKPWNSKTYHSIGEEENSVQGSKEKSGFLCIGKQMVAAPDLQESNMSVPTGIC